MNGVRKACQGRPVTEADLAFLAQTVEESVRATGLAQLDANEVGLAILEPLRKLDEVAFMRFASVYQGWESLEDFEAAISLLRLSHGEDSADVRRFEHRSDLAQQNGSTPAESGFDSNTDVKTNQTLGQGAS